MDSVYASIVSNVLSTVGDKQNIRFVNALEHAPSDCLTQLWKITMCHW